MAKPKLKHRQKPIYPRISSPLRDRFKAYVAATGNTESSVVEAALQEYLDPARDTVLIRNRLDRLARLCARVETNARVSLEGLLGFVQMWLEHMPPLSPDSAATAKKQGRFRFERFMQDLRAGQYVGPVDGPGPGPMSIDAGVEESLVEDADQDGESWDLVPNDQG
jgi:predicted DNA-binding protein